MATNTETTHQTILDPVVDTPDDEAKHAWKLIQSCYDFPVDRHGQPINPKDQATLRAWRAAGIHHFVKQ